MATPYECLINERLMGGCNHPDASVEDDHFEGWNFEVAICDSCGLREILIESASGNKKSDPIKALKNRIPKHCADMTMIRRVLRQIETDEWRWSVIRMNEVFHCVISRGKHKVEGSSSSSELEAICNAVIKLARLV